MWVCTVILTLESKNKSIGSVIGEIRNTNPKMKVNKIKNSLFIYATSFV